MIRGREARALRGRLRKKASADPGRMEDAVDDVVRMIPSGSPPHRSLVVETDVDGHNAMKRSEELSGTRGAEAGSGTAIAGLPRSGTRVRHRYVNGYCPWSREFGHHLPRGRRNRDCEDE